MTRTSVIAIACAASVVGVSARAQNAAPPPPSFISAEFGAHTFLKDLTPQQKGMFTQYRAMPGKLTLTGLTARYAPEAGLRTYELDAAHIGYNDQSIAARATQPGLWDVKFAADRLPHTYSTQWRSMLKENGTGVYTLPFARPTTAQFNAAPTFTTPIRNQWDPTKLTVHYTPRSDLDTRVSYAYITKSGQKPIGMAFGSPGGNSQEVLEPIDNSTRELRISQSLARRSYRLQAGYYLSRYYNAIHSVTADNPARNTDATNATSRGRVSVAPGNEARGLDLSGAWSLPFTTRVSAMYAYSWWRQNQEMLPPTINWVIGDARLLQVPTHADVHAGTKTVNVQASTKPLPGVLNALSFGAKFRRFEFRDESGVTELPIVINADATIANSGAAMTVHRNPYRRENREVSARWAGRSPVSVGIDYLHDLLQLNPEERNVHKTVETGPRVTLDLTGFSWMQIRARYTGGQRRSEEFTEGTFTGTYQNASGILPEFRRFDIADRDRTRYMTTVTFLPLDAVSVSGTWQRGRDEYPDDVYGVPDSLYGVQKINNSMVGVDVDYAPFQRVSLSGGYTRERFDDRMRARYRTPTNTSNLTYNWIGRNNDDIATYYAGVTGVILPDRIEGGVRFEHSDASFQVFGMNPQTPTGGSASDITNATAKDFPEVTQKLQPINAWLQYRVSSELAVTLRFQAERYDQNDFRSNNLSVANGPTGSHIFLTNNYPSYNAQYFTFTLTYRPGAIRLSRPAL